MIIDRNPPLDPALIESFAQEFFPELYEQEKAYKKELATQFAPVILSPAFEPSKFYTVHTYREDFPILQKKVNGKNLIWLDNAATTQKPKCVMERMKHFYENENSNVHRGAHTLAKHATDLYEQARQKVAAFLNARSSKEIVFVRGTTEAINLVASTFGLQNLSEDDVIIISCLEHHANIVPWQILCQKTKATLKVIPVDEGGQIILSEYNRLLSYKTKLVAITMCPMHWALLHHLNQLLSQPINMEPKCW